LLDLTVFEIRSRPFLTECDFAFSRHDLPEVLQENLALEIRGRREDRVRAAPAVLRAI